MGLLRQKVNSLGLITFDKKLKPIRFHIYPNTLRALEYYLGFTVYLQSYIHFYTQLTAPLQEFKTLLLCYTPIAGQQCRAYSLKTKLEPPIS